MKTPRYFDEMRKRPDRARIQWEWIEHVVKAPVKEEIQEDGRIRR